MQSFVLLASVVMCAPPSGVHTAWRQDGGLWVTWYDVGGKGEKGAGSPRCKYHDASNGWQQVPADSNTYSDICDAPQCTRWTGWVHTAALPKGSQPTTTYTCGDDLNGFTKNITTSTQHHTPGSGIKFIVAADVGASPAAKAVQTAIMSSPWGEEAAFFLMPGDISYAGGNQSIWDDFANLWEPVSSRIPTLVSPGNHDGEFLYGNNYHLPASKWVGGGESGTAYSIRYPGPGEPITYVSDDVDIPKMTSTSFWWSAAYGPVRVITTSGVHNISAGSVQYNWLEKELSTASEKWVILTNHFPLYCTIDDCFCGNYTEQAEKTRCEPGADGSVIPGILEVNAVFIKNAIEPLLAKYNNVDLVLTGHEHAYERTLPVMEFSVPASSRGKFGFPVTFASPGAPVHVMAGMGGGGPDTKWRESSGFPWSAVRSNLTVDDTYPYGFMGFSLSPDETILSGTYYNVDSGDSSQTVVRDKFSIVKP
eukprot:TRINITY_DN12149_c0_g1_i1.p1 TRINITY_DN12149_c0_g1~~TRINITY_DN12149_c0_g1_i1.p1  ORF type:complete len:496 (+),score=86.17 TRINITY_DN12149_c0_g1_i1:54-1490(+)